MLTQLPCGQ